MAHQYFANWILLNGDNYVWLDGDNAVWLEEISSSSSSSSQFECFLEWAYQFRWTLEALGITTYIGNIPQTTQYPCACIVIDKMSPMRRFGGATLWYEYAVMYYDRPSSYAPTDLMTYAKNFEQNIEDRDCVKKLSEVGPNWVETGGNEFFRVIQFWQAKCEE